MTVLNKADYQVQEGDSLAWIDKYNKFIEDTVSKANALEQFRQDAETQINDANTQIANAGTIISSKDAEIASLNTQIADLNSQLTAQTTLTNDWIAVAAANEQPHFICGLSANQVLANGDQIYTLDCDTVLSSFGVSVSSSGIVTIDSGSDGNWEFGLLFTYLMDSSHASSSTTFTRGYIYEGSTQRAVGLSRRRAAADFFGTVSAGWTGSVSVNDTFSARAEFDWDNTPDCTIFEDAPAAPSGSQIPSGETAGGITGTYGPACRFFGIKK